MIWIYNWEISISHKLAVFILFSCIGGYLLGGFVDFVALGYLIQSVNFLMLISRIPQIYKNFTSKSTGTLSFINYFLNFVGCTARIFTVMKETNDIKMLIVHANGLFTNLLIVI